MTKVEDAKVKLIRTNVSEDFDKIINFWDWFVEEIYWDGEYNIEIIDGYYCLKCEEKEFESALEKMKEFEDKAKTINDCLNKMGDSSYYLKDLLYGDYRER